MKLDDIIEPLEQDTSCIDKYEYKILAYSSANRNGQIMSKDALKDQDGKRIPLKFGSGKDAEVIGDVELHTCGGGVSISISEEIYTKLMKMTKED